MKKTLLSCVSLALALAPAMADKAKAAKRVIMAEGDRVHEAPLVQDMERLLVMMKGNMWNLRKPQGNER